MENYEILGRIGKGAHGLVYKAIDLRSNRTVALKQIVVENLTNGMPKNTMREICVLRAMNSKHIVKLLDVTSKDCTVVIVMEYLQCSLADVIQDYERPLTMPLIKSYAKMLLLGVEAMHSNHLMHRDLKPANLLLSKDGVLKLADFGLARIYNYKHKDRLYTHQVGTRWYRAPELLYGAQLYTPSIDMWAVGCIIAEMIDKQPLFPGETDIGQLAIVIATLGTPTEETWPGLSQLPDYNKIEFVHSEGVNWENKFSTCNVSTVEFITKMILYDQNKRITAEKALLHRFFFERPLPLGKHEMPKLPEVKPGKEMVMKDFDEIIQEISDL